jgi:hypothetical protein
MGISYSPFKGQDSQFSNWRYYVIDGLVPAMFTSAWVTTIAYKLHLSTYLVNNISLVVFAILVPFCFYQDTIFFICSQTIFGLEFKGAVAVHVLILLLLMFYMALLALSHAAVFVSGISFDVGMVYNIMANWSQFSDMASSEKESRLLKTILLVYALMVGFLWLIRHQFRKSELAISNRNFQLFPFLTKHRAVRISRFFVVIYWVVYVPIAFVATLKTPHHQVSQNLLFKSWYDALNDPFHGMGERTAFFRYADPGKKVTNFDFLKRTPKSKIKNVVLFALESGRREVWPMDYNSEFAKRVLNQETMKNRDISPFFESLKNNGSFVSDHYSTVSYTIKALISLQCSMYPYPVDHIQEHELGYYHKCLPELLKEHGFSTMFMQAESSNWQYQRKTTEMMGLNLFAAEELEKKVNVSEFEKIHYFGYADQVMTPHLFNWVDEQIQQDKPFFLSYLTSANHHPFVLPSSFQTKRYGRDDIMYEDYINAYLNTIRYSDEFIKGFMEALDQRNLLEETLFVFVGDHAMVLGELDQFGTAGIRSGAQFHTPALLYTKNQYWGDKLKGKEIKGRRSHLDIVPTILDILNEDFSNDTRLDYGYDGYSFLHPATETPLLTFVNPGSTIVNLYDKNMVLSYEKSGVTMVFDLDKDPDMAHPLDLTTYRNGEMLDWKEEAESALLQKVKEIKFKYEVNKPKKN